MNKNQRAGIFYAMSVGCLFASSAFGAGTSYFTCTDPAGTSVFGQACWSNGIPNSSINEYAIFDNSANAFVQPGFVNGNLQTGFGAWDIIIGQNSTGYLEHLDTQDNTTRLSATVTATNNFILGQFQGSQGTYNKIFNATTAYNGPINTNIAQLFVGQSGTGNYIQDVDGSTTVSNFIHIGENATGNGLLRAGNGIVTTPALEIGYNGTGTLDVYNGQISVSSKIVVGANPGSIGTMNLRSSVGNVDTYNEYIGWSGNGTVTHSFGTQTVSNYLYLGYGSAGSEGTYNLGGGSLNADNARVGENTTGTVNISGGNFDITNTLGIGGNAGANGTMNISGGLARSTRTIVGWHGTGVINHSSGTNSTSLLELGLDNTTGATGTYNLSSTGNLYTGTFNVGAYSNGDFNQSGGTNTATTLAVGRYSGGNGVITQTGGTSTAHTETVVGWDGTGTVNHSGGSLTTTDLELGRDIGGVGTYTQTGNATTSITGTLRAGAGSGTYNLQGGKLTVNTIETTISGLAFNFTGGTLSADTVLGDLTNNGGILSPGASPGVTQIRGDYTQTSAGTFFVEIGGTTTAEYDMLDIFDVASLGGTLNVSLVDLGTGVFTPQAGDTFDILSAQSIIRPFDTLALASLANLGLNWQVSYLTDAFNTTDVVRLTVVSAVPVPATVWLFGSGLLGLTGIGRRNALDRQKMEE